MLGRWRELPWGQLGLSQRNVCASVSSRVKCGRQRGQRRSSSEYQALVHPWSVRVFPELLLEESLSVISFGGRDAGPHSEKAVPHRSREATVTPVC